ncbi:MAG: hypothetical protein EPN21_04075 [Methylococcaceae bacterium]|nr:MAG: hypothetical protein EPN21_04075 [Methylococcaceae bacterium]
MNYADCAKQRTDVNICVAENGRTFRLHNPQKRQVDGIHKKQVFGLQKTVLCHIQPSSACCKDIHPSGKKKTLATIQRRFADPWSGTSNYC